MVPVRFVTLLVILVAALAPSLRAEPDSEGVAFFERKIRPVLVKRCYECHSARAKKIGGKLLLDSREALLRGGESGPVLVVGKPESSRIIQALRWADELEMPPDDPLPGTVVHDFVEWVRRGAPDPRSRAAGGSDASESGAKDEAALWSFQPIADPRPPEVDNLAWPRDPIDRFVLARLEARNCQPAEDASADALIRRLYFGVVGLAPTFGEVEAFRADHTRDAKAAIESLVDDLLGRRAFGERWGRHWLDVARYGESNGNDGLGRNPTFPHAWRYRDYVIQSFHDDVPYDRFITEQIAGDLLPGASTQARNRQLVATGFLALGWKPAAAMNQNFAMDVVDDQINTVSTAVLGLSVACARCHDHKHDPISTRDYYALAGIFRSTETLWGKAANEGLTAPLTPLHELRREVEPEEDAASFVLAAEYTESVDALRPAAHARLDAEPGDIAVEKGVRFTEAGFAETENGRVRVETSIPADRYSVSFWFRNDIRNDARAITAYLFSHARIGDRKQVGDHLGIGGTHDKSKTGKLFVWNGQGADEVLKGRIELAVGHWHHVVLVREKRRVRVYLNGDTKPEIDGESSATAPENRSIAVGARNDRFAPLKGALAELAVFDRALTAKEAQRLYAASGRPPGTPRAARPALAMGARDKKKVEDCKVNIDGNSKKLGPVVTRGFLPACRTHRKPPSIDQKSSGRLQLAQWLVRGDHPQTARVIVNRIWLHLFGRGIVITPDDFGVYGARPSHPDLLDHLARRFVADGWSIKKMIRAIVLTRVYQLSSHPADERVARIDSDNVLIARHNRRRLDAESLRDRILQVSGQLDPKPVVGSAIDSLDALINWPPGEARYLHEPSRHRSVYLCMLRDSPPSELAAFNLPGGVAVAGQRETTTTATQTLFLLNSPLVVEQSLAFAKSLLAMPGGSLEDRVRLAYRRALSRNPRETEVRRALRYHEEMRRELDTAADASTRAWASLCQALLASNEFRYID